MTTTGDEVEFIGLRHLGVAVAVQLLPRQIRNEGIIFKRAPVNAELKSTIKNTGFKGRNTPYQPTHPPTISINHPINTLSRHPIDTPN